MAYGLKYTSTWWSEDWSGRTPSQYVLEIYLEGFSGASSDICMGGKPCTEKQITTNDLPYGIKSCRYDFTIVDENLSVDDFYSENSKDYMFALYEVVSATNVLTRKGYLLSEDSSEEYVDGVKTINISGTDGIELLKTIKYEISDDKNYSGVISILFIIQSCLNKISLGININTGFNYYPDGLSQDGNIEPLAFQALHADLFKGLNCYEVLERVCVTQQCVLEQEDGEWWYLHKINPDGSTLSYRKWSAAYAYIGDYTIPSPVDVEFNGIFAPLMQPTILKNRPYKRVISEVEIQGYESHIRNAEFQDGLNEWTNIDTDSQAFGGIGTNKDPYYLQINGYQPKNITDFLNIGLVHQKIKTLYDISLDDNIEDKLNKTIRISGSVRGKGVKKTYVTVCLRIETNQYLYPYIFLCLSETGEWVSLGVTDSGQLVFPKINILKHNINIDLVDSDGVQKDEYVRFNVESTRLSDIIVKTNGIWGFIDNGILSQYLNLKKIKVEDFEKVDLFVGLYEGHGQTQTSDSPEWVRWGDLSLEILDKTRSAGLKSNKYISEKTGDAPNELTIERYFADFFEKEQFITILSETSEPTTHWETSNENNSGDLITCLTRELFSLYYNPIKLYDGGILGRIKKYNSINLEGYDRSLISTNWVYDFGTNIAENVRYLMTFANYIGSNNKKYGVYGDNKEVLYDGEYPTGQLDYDYVPIVTPELLSRNLTSITRNTIFTDGHLSFDKVDLESGLNWYNNSTGELSDYILTSDIGFAFKSEVSDYQMILDFSELTTDKVLKIPNIVDDAFIATSETAWMFGGNTVAAKKTIGTINAYDIGVIRENIEVATFGTTGLTLPTITETSGGVVDFLAIEGGVVKKRTIANTRQDLGFYINTPTSNQVLIYDPTYTLFINRGLVLADISDIVNASTSTSGLLTAADWNIFNAKQAALVSGTNIKTINSVTLLGSGNIALTDLNYWTKTGTTLSYTAGRVQVSAAGAFTDDTGAVLQVNGNTKITLGSLYLPPTTYAAQHGVIYRNSVRFLHGFSFGSNGTVTPTGNNTFVGELAGNLYMGYNASSGAYEASNNVGIGSSSLMYNNKGYFNTAIGGLTLYLNTDGYANTAISYAALLNCTTGFNNTAIAFASLYSLTTGSNNIGIGYSALYNITTGTNNLGFGYNTGLGITTGSYNTIIGSNVTGLSATLANTIIIADGSGAKRIYINSSGNTGYGTENPTEKMHIVGNLYVTGNIDPDGHFSGTDSDKRLKSNLKNLTVIDKLRDLSGAWTYDHTKYEKSRQIGWIAQELINPFPELISYDRKGFMRVSDYGMASLALQGVKELDSEVEILKKRIVVLEQKLQNNGITD